jgi:hypothetical protein
LDQRYEGLLRRAAKLKTTEDLAAWWMETSAGRDLPGAFWATLTHPRCTGALSYAVLGQVHMLQHQVGMAARFDQQRLEVLIDENATLSRDLAQLQSRGARQMADAARRIDDLDAELVRQRAQTLAREAELAQERDARAALEAAVPGLRDRHVLTRENRDLHTRLQAVQRELAASRDAERRRHAELQLLRARLEVFHRAAPSTIDVAARERRGAGDSADPGEHDPETPALTDRAILCVGGRPASLSLYRLVVERTGGRFLHHDGGDEESVGRLEATLAAADLVICQTGCVSHNAYWRVKDHCKRTGKRCVFVDTPSRSALERALADVAGSPA